MSDVKQRIDWEAVKARLRTIQASSDIAAARREAVLRQRALELAERSELAESEAGAISILAFLIGKDRYGLPLAELEGVLPLKAWTAVPGAADELLGVVNHRGRICSVLRLERLLGLPTTAGAAGPGYILLLRAKTREVGLRVDNIDAIRRVAPSEIVPLGDLASAGAGLAQHRTRDGVVLLAAELLRAHTILREESSP